MNAKQVHRFLLSPPLIGILAGLALVAGLRLNAAVAAGPPQTFEGELEVTHSDDFAHGHATFAYKLKTARGDFDLTFNEHHPVVPRATRIKVTGQQEGKSIRVTPGSKVVAADGSGATGFAGDEAAAVSGSKRVAVILIKFSQAQTEPYTPAFANGIAFTNANSVAAYYAENSNGQLTMTGDVFGWWAISGDTSTCNYSAWSNAADQYAAANGFDLSSYHYRVYAFPSVSACGWAGLAYLPGTKSYLNGTGGMSLRVMSHELGHNLGTHHSSTSSCTEGGVRVSIPTAAGTCTLSEYGDPFTVMGSSSNRHHTNFSLGNFGWMTTANTQDVNATTTVSLTAASDPSSTAVKSVRIPRPSGDYLVLELRKPYGTYFDNFGPADAAVTGVSVRIAPGYTSMVQSKLVDSTPATTSFSDAPLPAGATLRDPIRGVTITNLGVSNGVATVNISFEADTQAPTTPGSLTAQVLSASQVRLNWSASTDNVGVTGYEVRRNGQLLTTTTSLTYTDSGLTGGTQYSYAVRAKDAANNVSADATTVVQTIAPDTQAPTTPGSLSATGISTSQVRLNWTASTDNTGVTGYEIRRAGVLIATTTSLTYTDSGLTTNTSYAYAVRAKDAANNVSPDASVTGTTLAGDSQAPTAPPNLTGTPGNRRASLSWGAATDNVGVVRYQVYRNGTLVGTTANRSYTDRPSRGTYTYTVKAVDAAGNVSPASNALTLTVR